MKIKVARYKFSDKATMGRMYVNGNQQCYTLEDRCREIDGQSVYHWKVPNETAIPRGTYVVVIDFSDHFHRTLPHVLDVPGFDGIRIHPGNTDIDTEGCILVGGIPLNDDFIPNSRSTFDSLFQLMENAEQSGETMTLEIA